MVNQHTRSRRHAGFTMTEVVVAATLLVSTIGVIAPLTVQCGRLLQTTRHHYLVLDELSNQFQRLCHLDDGPLTAAIGSITPSEHLVEALPAVWIRGETVRDQDGARLILSLNWDRVGDPPPLQMVGWLDSIAVATDADEVNQ